MEELNIEIKRGDDLQFELVIPDYNGDPLDVTGYTYLSQIRPAKESVQVLGDFTVTDIDASVGEVLLTLSHVETEAMNDTFPSDGVAYWDIEVQSDAATPIITTPWGGEVTFVDDVSRD